MKGMRNLEKARQESDYPIYPTELMSKHRMLNF